MRSSSKIKENLFKNQKFYLTQKCPKKVLNSDYQSKNGNNSLIYTPKRYSTTFKQHQFSSSENPLPSYFKRLDKPFELTEHKLKMVDPHSHLKTNPYSSINPELNYSRKSQQSQIQAYLPSKQYKIQVQKKFFLPQDRQYSRPTKNYHFQLGMSKEMIKKLLIHNNGDSTNMKLCLSSSHLNYSKH